MRVEKLIELHEKAGSFLERPAAGAGPTVELLVEQPGMQVGPYKLLQPIGEGGMGVVYMAEQLEPVRRMVALKVIKPGMDSRQVIARFEAERQALAMMDHVNIARVIDAGTTEAGRPCFVMELVHGVPITQYCDDNHLTPRRRLELFVPVCQAIQHAHQKGIIHRDIKPSNVMVTLYDGQPVPKVIDFGVAKATAQRLTERTLFTQYGTLVGTLEYMSPEQAEMNALGVDRVVAAEGLAESRLEAETQARKQAKASYEEASTQKKRAEESAREADQQRRIAVENENTARQQEGIARQSEQMAKDQELLARRRFYAAQMNLAHQAWQAGNRPRVLELLEGQRPRFDEQDLRGFEWYYFWRLCQQGHRFTLRGPRRGADSVVYSPDGRLLATAGMDNTVRLWDAATGQLRSTLVGYWRGWKQIAFSPDGKLPAHGAGPNRDAVTLFDTGTGQVQRVLPTRGSVRLQAFSPDGKTLASGGQDGTVRLWSVETYAELCRIDTGSGFTTAVAFSPDGRLLAEANYHGQIRLWDVATGRQCLAMYEAGVLGGVLGLAFSPDGQTLAVGLPDGTIKLRDPQSGRLRRSLKGDTAYIVSLAYFPDGRTLASGSGSGIVKLWDLATGQELMTLSEGAHIAITADGNMLAAAHGDKVVVHRAATDTEAIVYRSELDPDDVDSPVAQNAAADMLLSAEQLQEAEELCRQAAARLEKLAAHFPDTPDYRAQLARSHLGLGLIKHWRKEVQSSAEHYRRALKELETVAAAWPGVLEHHEDVARARFALSDRLAAAGGVSTPANWSPQETQSLSSPLHRRRWSSRSAGRSRRPTG